MFLSYLQSMQNKSQDAQNPGLWVNGNRMPVQESLLGAAVRGIGKVAKFGYGLGNNLGNGMMNTANTAVSGSPLKRPARYGDAGRNPNIQTEGDIDLDGMYRPRPSPGGRPRPSPDWAPDYPYPNPGDEYRPNFIKPRPSPGGRPRPSPGWAPDYPYPNPGDEYRPSFIKPRPSPGGRLPGLINPKPKSPGEITVDDIINPNTGNVSLSTGEANKPGAVTLYPAGQNILNPPTKPKFNPQKDYIRPRPGPGIAGAVGADYQDQNRYQKPDRIDHTIGAAGDVAQKQLQKDRMDRLLRKRGNGDDANSGEPLGIIPLQADPNLMNRMY